MTTDEFQRLSFAATIAFGIVAQAALVAAGLWAGSKFILFCALLSIGTAYLAQHFATDYAERPAQLFQIASVAAWAAGALAIIGA